MRLRLAKLADQEAIARVHCASWDAAFSTFALEIVKARGEQFPRRLQQWGELLQNEQVFTYVGIDIDEKIVGFGQGGAARDELDVSYDGELHRLYVAPDKKGHGIGKLLINKVSVTLKEQGKHSLVVVAWSINTSARKVYEHLGATYVKEIVQEKDGFNTSQTVYVWENINMVIEATS